MESRPQNPELRNNPENFHPCSVDQSVMQYSALSVTSHINCIVAY